MTFKTIRRLAVGAAALGALVALATPADAQRWRDCRDKIYDAHHRLELAIANYGNNSREARIHQREYNDVRDWCWRQYRGWWDERYGRWRTDHW